MSRIKNFGDWQVPDTVQGCITYIAAAKNQIKRNKDDNRRLEQLIAECDRRIEAKTKKESEHGRHTQAETIH